MSQPRLIIRSQWGSQSSTVREVQLWQERLTNPTRRWDILPAANRVAGGGSIQQRLAKRPGPRSTHHPHRTVLQADLALLVRASSRCVKHLSAAFVAGFRMARMTSLRDFPRRSSDCWRTLRSDDERRCWFHDRGPEQTFLPMPAPRPIQTRRAQSAEPARRAVAAECN